MLKVMSIILTALFHSDLITLLKNYFMRLAPVGHSTGWSVYLKVLSLAPPPPPPCSRCQCYLGITFDASLRVSDPFRSFDRLDGAKVQEVVLVLVEPLVEAAATAQPRRIVHRHFEGVNLMKRRREISESTSAVDQIGRFLKVFGEIIFRQLL